MENNKALVLTGLDRKLERHFANITKRNLEDLIIINSYEEEISQGFSSLMRNIILAVYMEKIADIYIIVEKYDKGISIDPEDLYALMEEGGGRVEVIQTLNYIKTFGQKDMMEWLSVPNHPESIIQNNIEFIKKHPLIPRTVKVHGYIVNKDYYYPYQN
ncbi:carbonic anhydrase [Sutcliffiella horikoshii]|uniref:hypothetical protein n=1 Tax=Sutcliffiella horikoshii TaxID=79883 RepID=UPI001CFE77A6|nr:hypothetical protein [Sutcliffiella horikoshii]